MKKWEFIASDRLPAIGRRLIQLRWWLLVGLGVAVLAAPTLLGVALPWPLLLVVLLLLAGFNFVVQRRIGRGEMGAAELAGQLSVDLTMLGVMLYLTGGAANPFVSLMLVPVAVAALALPAHLVGAIAGLAMGIYSFLMLFSLPLSIADAERATRLHLGGMWLTFVVSATIIAWFMTRMAASIRERDAQLASAREQALRDAQVVALGQLAAGAAHELGTPLATISVLATELREEPNLTPGGREDLELLRRQLVACKEIVGGLTQKAGIARAEPTQGIPVDRWLDALLGRWRTLWPGATCLLDVRGKGRPPQIPVDASIEQAIMNLLNNAVRVAPHGMRFIADWDEMFLRLAICDRGPGFPPEILRGHGAEPISAHADGSGIGLWLTRAAVERLGGGLHLENAEEGGMATIVLPLAGPGQATRKGMRA